MAINKNFTVKNGLEVNTSLIFADADTRKVGILVTEPIHDLHVNGGVGVTNLVVAGVSTFSGISTFSNNVYVSGITTADGGVSTGVTALTVIGDLRVTGDIYADDIEFDVGDLAEINVTGIGTINTLYSSGGNIVAGFATVTNQINVSGDALFSGITTINNLAAGVATEFYAATGIQSGGVFIGAGVTTINFAGVGATLVTVNGTTANVFISGGPGISSVGIQSGGTFVGNATTLNFVGSGVSSVTISGNVAEVFVGVSTVVYEQQISTVGIATSVFNFEYNAGAVEVFYNGAKLVKSTDYTATDGSTVTLDFLTNPGDTVEIKTYTNSISSIDRTFWSNVGTGIHTTASVGIGTTVVNDVLTVVGDARIGINTTQGVVLSSENGTRYRLYVENNGTLKTRQVFP